MVSLIWIDCYVPLGKLCNCKMISLLIQKYYKALQKPQQGWLVCDGHMKLPISVLLHCMSAHLTRCGAFGGTIFLSKWHTEEKNYAFFTSCSDRLQHPFTYCPFLSTAWTTATGLLLPLGSAHHHQL